CLKLDKFTYFTQFLRLCLFLFTLYIPICNDGDGVLGIVRILKLRNQAVSHRKNKIRTTTLTVYPICTQVYSKYPNGVTSTSLEKEEDDFNLLFRRNKWLGEEWKETYSI
ncbi:hypothetical protein H5410_001694, partial [Solanum commersonii]